MSAGWRTEGAELEQHTGLGWRGSACARVTSALACQICKREKQRWEQAQLQGKEGSGHGGHLAEPLAQPRGEGTLCQQESAKMLSADEPTITQLSQPCRKHLYLGKNPNWQLWAANEYISKYILALR